MTGTVVVHKTQVGQSGTAANNFTIRTLNDGSLRISRGNAGAEISDVLVIDANGNFSTAPVLGVGQTWQDVTASRTAATTYTNSTGRPISVCVITSGTAANLEITVAGMAVWRQSAAVNSGSIEQGVNVIVPAGATYSVQISYGSLYRWMELR